MTVNIKYTNPFHCAVHVKKENEAQKILVFFRVQTKKEKQNKHKVHYLKIIQEMRRLWCNSGTFSESSLWVYVEIQIHK